MRLWIAPVHRRRSAMRCRRRGIGYTFWRRRRCGEAGRDGHAERGEFLPPVALPRRMWGGGRLEFSRAITIGETIKKQSTITDITQKNGRSGALCFVTVRHEFFAGDEMKMSEEHDIVYREDGDKNAPVTNAANSTKRRRRQHRNHAEQRITFPLLRANFQQPPHPLRRRLLPRSGRLTGPWSYKDP